MVEGNSLLDHGFIEGLAAFDLSDLNDLRWRLALNLDKRVAKGFVHDLHPCPC